MTPFMLLDALENTINDCMKELVLKCGKTVRFYQQNAPMRRNEADDEIIFPYCLVRLGDGESDRKATLQDVVLIFATFDDSEDYEGYCDVINMVEAVRQRFAKQPEMGVFEVSGDMKWSYAQDDETYPYYFGALLLRVALPTISCVSNYI